MTFESFLAVVVAFLAIVGCSSAAREEYFSTSSADTAGYLTWLSNKGVWYSSDAFVQSGIPGEGAAIFWEFVDDTDDVASNATNATASDATNATDAVGDMKIQMAVAVPATGWVAAGFTLSGMMADSDIFVYDLTSPDDVTDYYIAASLPRSPMMDTCQSWELLDVTIDGMWTIVEVSRSLDTLDTQDLVVGASITTTLISAWNDFTSFGYHGANKGVQSVSLFGDDVVDASLTQTTVFGSAPAGCL